MLVGARDRLALGSTDWTSLGISLGMLPRLALDSDVGVVEGEIVGMVEGVDVGMFE